jgi:hypothetical protein
LSQKQELRKLQLKKNNMKQILVCGIGALILVSCKKQSCYDPELEKAFQSIGCTTDCPGVKGCDGKTYCNECEANRQGIRVVE